MCISFCAISTVYWFVVVCFVIVELHVCNPVICIQLHVCNPVQCLFLVVKKCGCFEEMAIHGERRKEVK